MILRPPCNRITDPGLRTTDLTLRSYRDGRTDDYQGRKCVYDCLHSDVVCSCSVGLCATLHPLPFLIQTTPSCMFCLVKLIALVSVFVLLIVFTE